MQLAEKSVYRCLPGCPTAHRPQLETAEFGYSPGSDRSTRVPTGCSRFRIDLCGVAWLIQIKAPVAYYALDEAGIYLDRIGIVALALGLANVVFENRSHVRRFVIGTCYFFIGLGYTIAAFQSLLVPGPTGWMAATSGCGSENAQLTSSRQRESLT